MKSKQAGWVDLCLLGVAAILLSYKGGFLLASMMVGFSKDGTLYCACVLFTKYCPGLIMPSPSFPNEYLLLLLSEVVLNSIVICQNQACYWLFRDVKYKKNLWLLSIDYRYYPCLPIKYSLW